MKKKHSGRPRVILDEYTLRILKALHKKNYSISQLADELGVAYNNLLNKLDYLGQEQVIIRDESSKGRTVIIKVNPAFIPGLDYIFDNFKKVGGRKGLVEVEYQFGIADLLYILSTRMPKKH